jgi:RND family efflux transporter MFP subunit
VSKSSISSKLELLGTVINDRSVTITALLDGEIVSTRVREGDRVEEGDLLAELDSEAAQLQLEKAKADLLYQQVYLAQVEKNLARQQGLADKGSATMQSVDDTLLEKKRVEAAVEVADAELAIRKLFLENAQIVAPFTGTIITQSAERGQWVEAGTQLFVLVADEGRVIEAQVDADDAAQVSLGQAAQLSSDSFVGQTWDSTIVWLAPSITRNNDGASNTFAIRIALDSNAPNLLLDQQLDVTIVTDSREDVLVIPQKLLSEPIPGEFSVMLIENEEARLQRITTGLFSTSDVEVTEGIAEGDLVMQNSDRPVNDGQAVHVVN